MDDLESKASTMTIRIMNMSNSVYTVVVDSDATVQNLKEKIEVFQPSSPLPQDFSAQWNQEKGEANKKKPNEKKYEAIFCRKSFPSQLKDNA